MAEVSLEGAGGDLAAAVDDPSDAEIDELLDELRADDTGLVDPELDVDPESIFDDEPVTDDAKIDAVRTQLQTPRPAQAPPRRGLSKDQRAQVAKNIAALSIEQKLRGTGTMATDSDREILAAYAGWGGVAEVFDERTTGTTRELREELRDVLGTTEYNQARRSIDTAFYTPPELTAAVWELLDTAGLREGTVLEPGCGIGTFLTDAPEGVRTIGVELDPSSARIAAALHPQSQVRNESFAETDLPDGSVVAAVGNVPFGNFSLDDPVHNALGLPIHDHFISKSIALTAPGGYVAVVTSAGTADKPTGAGEYGSRTAMIEHADLITAVRLPGGKNGAFSGEANTAVVADLLVFRVRETGQEPTVQSRQFLETEQVQVDGHELTVNSYFAAHEDHILGELHAVSGPWGYRQAVTVPERDLSGLADQMIEVAGNDVAAATDVGYGLTADPGGVDISDVDVTGLIERGTTEMNEVVGTLRYIRDGKEIAFEQYLPVPAGVSAGDDENHEDEDGSTRGKPRNAWQTVKPPNKNLAQEWTTLVDLRNTLRALQLASEDSELEQAEALRRKLNEDYDAYVEQYGYINRHTYAPARTPTAAQAEKKLAELESTWRLDNAIGDRAYEGELPEDVAEELRDIAESPVENRNPVRKHLRGVIGDDPFMSMVYGLENYSEQAAKAKKGAWFFTDPLHTVVEITHADTIEDAVTIAAASDEGLTTAKIAALMDLTEQDTETTLQESGAAYRDHRDPDRWIAPVAYLSGNVREKLRSAEHLAEDDPRYETNVTALTAVQPEKITSGITMNLGATWIPPEFYKQFIVETTNMPSWSSSELQIHNVGDQWRMTSEPKEWSGQDDAAVRWGLSARHNARGRFNFEMKGRIGELAHCGVATKYRSRNMVISGEQMIVHAMNLAAPELKWSKEAREIYPNLKGNHTEASQFATRKVEEIKEAFQEWIVASPQRHAELIEIYNEHFNSVVAPKYDGSRREMPGLGAKFSPYPYQLNAVERIVNEPAVLLNHVVGAGKTGTMIMGAMELKRLGKVNKPWLVVPNHLVEQIAREANQWYPAARVLSGASARGGKKNRQLFLAQSASLDWDLVVVPESVFTATGLRPEGIESYGAGKVAQLQDELDQMVRDGTSDASVKEIENTIKAYDLRIKGMVAKAKKDDGLRFEDTGCDYVIADEAHGYKNLMRPSRVADLAGPASQKASDMDMKLSWMRDTLPRDHPIVTFATGTPIANNIAELWVMQQYLRPDLLRSAQVGGVNSWGANFTEAQSDLAFTAGGNLITKSRVAKYVNVADLAMMCTPFQDVVGYDQITAQLPELKGGGAITHEFEPGMDTKDFIADLPWRESEFSLDLRQIDNPLKVVNDGRNVTLDPRLAGLPAPEPGVGRVSAVCDEIIAEWEQSRDNVYLDQLGDESPNRGGLQIVFCDKGVPNKSGRFSVYDGIRDELVSRGMDRDRIRFIHEWDKNKLQLFDDCNNGLVDVVIGNTAKMGTGANIQSRAVALHHIDVPWRPADLEQQRGRIVRQGNQNDQVTIHEYIGLGTYDGYSWGVLLRKAKFIEQFNNADPEVREAESLESEGSDAMAHNRALATGNQDFVRLLEVENDVKKLASRKAEWEANRLSNARELEDARTQQPILEKMIAQYAAVADSVAAWQDATLEPEEGKELRRWSVVNASGAGETEYTERAEAARAFSDTMRQVVRDRDTRGRTIGTIAGVTITARYSHQDSGVYVQTVPRADDFGKAIGSEEILAGSEQVATDKLDKETRAAQSSALMVIENSIRQIPRAQQKTLGKAASVSAALERLENVVDGGFAEQAELTEKTAEKEAIEQRLKEFEKSDAEVQRKRELKRRNLNKGRLPGWSLALNPTAEMVNQGMKEHPATAVIRQRMEKAAAEGLFSAGPDPQVSPQVSLEKPEGYFGTTITENLADRMNRDDSEVIDHDDDDPRPSPDCGTDTGMDL